MRGTRLLDTAFLVAACVGPLLSDSFESYLEGSDINGQNGGTPGTNGGFWGSAYRDTNNYTGLQCRDDMEGYAENDPLNGLNDGDCFTSPYVSKDY